MNKIISKSGVKNCTRDRVSPSHFLEEKMDFLDERNNCGQTILKLVSRANAIIAELLRLSQNIPPIFKLESKEDKSFYGHLLPDFSYFKEIEYYERGIDASVVSYKICITILFCGSGLLLIMPRLVLPFHKNFVRSYKTEMKN